MVCLGGPAKFWWASPSQCCWFCWKIFFINPYDYSTGSWLQTILLRDWRGNTEKFFCPSLGNGLGWLCHDHRGFLHGQPRGLPGAGQTSDQPQWNKWSPGMNWLVLNIKCVESVGVSEWLSVLPAAQSSRELHLRHSEGICSGYVLQATGLITLTIITCQPPNLPPRWNYPICTGQWRELTTKIRNLPYKPFSMGKYWITGGVC